jgi:hypothetical protein
MSGSGSASQNGVADMVARAHIRNHGEAIKDLRADVRKVDDEVSDVRRYIAEVKPFIMSLRKIAYVGTIGIMGVLGAEVWRLIMARP